MWLWIIDWLKPTYDTFEDKMGKKVESLISTTLWPDRLNRRKSSKTHAFISEVGGSDPEHTAETE